MAHGCHTRNRLPRDRRPDRLHVDWQPYVHLSWRVAVGDAGPVTATADLEPADRGTLVRFRWAQQDGTAMTRDTANVIRVEREAAFERLGRVVANLPSEVVPR